VLLPLPLFPKITIRLSASMDRLDNFSHGNWASRVETTEGQ
jgi:hypothetical protein